MREPRTLAQRRARVVLFVLPIAAIAVLALTLMGPELAFYGRPILHGKGRIVLKTVAGAGDTAVYSLDIEAQLPDAPVVLRGVVRVRESDWDRVSAGDGVEVDYQVSLTHSRSRIVRIYQGNSPDMAAVGTAR